MICGGPNNRPTVEYWTIQPSLVSESVTSARSLFQVNASPAVMSYGPPPTAVPVPLPAARRCAERSSGVVLNLARHDWPSSNWDEAEVSRGVPPVRGGPSQLDAEPGV